MNRYTVIVSKTAEKQLDKLSDHLANSIIGELQKLADNPRPHGYKKLSDRPGYRIRKGNFRIIYDIHDKILIVNVISIGHRKDVYD